MTDRAGHLLREGDRVRIHAATPLTRRGRAQVGWVVLLEPAGSLGGGGDPSAVVGVLVASEPGGQWPRMVNGWCGWYGDVEKLPPVAAEGGG